MVSGERVAVIDAKGYHRGMKQWVICPVCEEGRWVRDDSIKRKSFSAMCRGCQCKYTGKQGEEHPSWKGGRSIRGGGYIKIRIDPDDFFYPMADTNNQVWEHRLVMAKHLNRCLLPWEIVHHINGNRQDNRIENLMLMKNIYYHIPSMAVQSIINRLENQVLQLERKLESYEKQLISHGLPIKCEESLT
jgi:hypothetical protein